MLPTQDVSLLQRWFLEAFLSYGGGVDCQGCRRLCRAASVDMLVGRRHRPETAFTAFGTDMWSVEAALRGTLPLPQFQASQIQKISPGGGFLEKGRPEADTRRGAPAAQRQAPFFPQSHAPQWKNTENARPTMNPAPIIMLNK